MSGRSWRPISTRSARPALVTRPTRATFPVRSALRATVVPCTTRSPGRTPPSSASPARIARTGSAGVEATFATRSARPSTATRSVKVPPVSIPIVRPKRDLLPPKRLSAEQDSTGSRRSLCPAKPDATSHLREAVGPARSRSNDRPPPLGLRRAASPGRPRGGRGSGLERRAAGRNTTGPCDERATPLYPRRLGQRARRLPPGRDPLRPRARVPRRWRRHPQAGQREHRRHEPGARPRSALGDHGLCPGLRQGLRPRDAVPALVPRRALLGLAPGLRRRGGLRAHLAGLPGLSGGQGGRDPVRGRAGGRSGRVPERGRRLARRAVHDALRRARLDADGALVPVPRGLAPPGRGARPRGDLGPGAALRSGIHPSPCQHWTHAGRHRTQGRQETGGLMAERPFQRVVVIGDGGWGTTLALLLNRRGVEVTLWSAFPEHVEELRRD